MSAPDEMLVTTPPREDVAKRVAIIMDGNGRWASGHGLPVSEGHRAGTRAVRRTVEAAIDLGIESLTVYAFSTENWTRPADEVGALMEIFGETIERELPDLCKQGVRVRFIGRRDRVPEDLRRRMAELESETAENTRLDLWVALNYGGRAEIVDAARRLVEDGVPRGRGRRGRARVAAVRTGASRPGPVDPHVRGGPHVELPSLAARLCRARLRRHALARLRCRGPARRARRVREARPPLRRTLRPH